MAQGSGNWLALKAIHDVLRRIEPEDADHTDCAFCNGKMEASLMGDSLTEDEVKAQIDKAVADAQAAADARIKELEDKLATRDADEATTKAVEDALKPLNDKVAELEKNLEDELIKRQGAEADLKKVVDWLDEESESVAKVQRRDQRIAAVKDTGIFPEDAFDESTQANKDRIDKWAEMTDDAFESVIDGYKAKPAAAPEKGNGKVPDTRSAITDALTETKDKTSPVQRVMASTISVPSS